MASYKEHITFSTLCGLGYGAAAAYYGPFTPVQAAIAGSLTGLAGMLPDLDSQSGRPVRELSGLVAAIAPFIAIRHLVDVIGSIDGLILAGGIAYVLVRYGGAWLLGKLSVHRGMFHSLPALGIAALLVFLGYKSDNIQVRLLMAGGVALGYFSHLLLDEIYAVQWNGVRVRLSKAAGSALKIFGGSMPANAFCYGLLLFLSYAALVKVGFVPQPAAIDAPPTHMATQPTETKRL